MGNQWPELKREVEFHLLTSLPDAHPVIVQRGCHTIDVASIPPLIADSCASGA